MPHCDLQLLNNLCHQFVSETGRRRLLRLWFFRTLGGPKDLCKLSDAQDRNVEHHLNKVSSA
jgi:hypothetical protein